MIVAVVMTVMTTAFTAAMGGVVYKVGDSAGWTNIGHVDYKSWASAKRFHAGDAIVFTYNRDFQNVVRVPYTGYLTCNGAVSYDTFTSGNDTFPIKLPGHYYFICTLPGHCESGQKVDIRVPLNPEYNYPPPANPAGGSAPIQPLPFPYPPPPVASPSPSLVKSPLIQSPPPSSVKKSPSSSSSPPAIATPHVAPAPAEKNSACKPAIGLKLWTTSFLVVFVYLIAF
ncbi:hypothetical protein L6452_43246 [Arctium lappa]|uniref:Uncharacterized protein n=1 Tax=Arctium lappa TaxID=4217 RepID=A0ACB8XL26_ARCLA|nr:hypothetical protein L6452_43246 [Arctium lappa]